MDRRRLTLLAAILVLLVLLAWLGGCSDPGPLEPEPPPSTPSGSCAAPLPAFNPFPNGLAPVGTDTTVDIATWNLEFFPLRLPGDFECPHPVDTNRERAAANLINLLELDVIAVQEISDTTGFRQLLALLPDYAGVLSPELRGCNYQRVGLIYRTDVVTLRGWHLLFTGDTYAFPRSPLQADLTISTRGHFYDLSVIVVHLKASGDSQSQARRRSATNQLKSYLDQQAVVDSTANFMIAGDWNDVLDEPISISSFPAFLNDPEDYEFLNESLVGNSAYASHSFGGGSLIDHLMVNRAACPDFSGARVTTLRLDLVVSGYGNVSDHRPVVVQAPMLR